MNTSTDIYPEEAINEDESANQSSTENVRSSIAKGHVRKSKVSELSFQTCSEEVLLEKYAKGNEKKLPGHQAAEQIRRRVAKGLASVEDERIRSHWESEFFDVQNRGHVIMAGRVNSAAGTELDATLMNCFVQPVGDFAYGLEDGVPGIYRALEEASQTMRKGGGEGYDFSAIRPKGARVKSVDSTASGPVSFMNVFDENCKTLRSHGSRRGAQMGVLRVDHPDIRDFIQAKSEKGALTQFNVSVAVTEIFMRSLLNREKFQLIHDARPSQDQIEGGAFQRENGTWVYEDNVDPTEIWDLIMRNTYNQAEPGVIFIDEVNKENNLSYVEMIAATNPCGEQPLPPYGCCCLGSINLPSFVLKPAFFSEQKDIDSLVDWAGFKAAIAVAVRMLDNVLSVSAWPLEAQKEEAFAKRRIGLGITGLGNMLTLLNLRYDSDEGLKFAEKIAQTLRDEAYLASVNLAKEKGAFKLFDNEKYLNSPFIQRLPPYIQKQIKKHGIRNSHLISIAPTGTISLAFADNTSNGIEPAFTWEYVRNKLMDDGTRKPYTVYDHSYRVFLEGGGDKTKLPVGFVDALSISPIAHLKMIGVFAKYVDSAISKTINCPKEISYDEFKDIYLKAYHLGLKGVTTFRPNDVTGAVLETKSSKDSHLDTTAERNIRLTKVPEPALKSLRWPKRPKCQNGNPSVTYMVEHPINPFAVFIGQLNNGNSHPFEVWVNGQEQPRALGALAKVLSMDMRAQDKAWLKFKLESLVRTSGTPFEMVFPSQDSPVKAASEVSALAKLVKYQCEELGYFNDIESTPLLDCMFATKEPKSEPEGTTSFTVDINNPSTGDDFAIFLKELELPNGQIRPYSIWSAGEYPEAFHGLFKCLSMDMRIIDPAWIGKKLRSLKDFPEYGGDFREKTPGSNRSEIQPSTIAYIARVIINRYRMLGILDKEGYPIEDMGIFNVSSEDKQVVTKHKRIAGKACPECAVTALIKQGGCDFCTNCGYTGSCG